MIIVARHADVSSWYLHRRSSFKNEPGKWTRDRREALRLEPHEAAAILLDEEFNHVNNRQFSYTAEEA